MRVGWADLSGAAAVGRRPESKTRESSRPRGVSRRFCRGLEAVGEGGVAATGAGGPDRDGQGLAAADQHDQAFGPGDGGVEQVALEQGVGAHGQRHDHGRVLAALGAVHGDGVGVLSSSSSSKS